VNALPTDEVLRARAAVVGLPSLLQLAELEGLTGRIEVGGSGHVELHDGVAVHARCGMWEGVDALCELMLADAVEV
jgi:hypothetical protein